VFIGHEYPCFHLKKTGIFHQLKGHNSKTEKADMSEIKPGLPFIVADHVYKFQTICIRGT
jgi:hypothetical protein